MIGKSLGPYEIVERLGAGGMGEVYRARDTTLQRDIAIKILPIELAGDPERLARFRQEARLLAGVHHANIAAVYGLENIDGVQFFTQELVRGHTLSTRIKEGLDLEEIIAMGAQMADALETAHAHGIVHRDLKPANVMVTDDGRVKVLDFGLARPVVTNDDAQPSGESTPTISTVRPEGVVLGTAAYMSPDQARGRNVDHRGDIWAFGCVMFESLTQRKAFDGETLLDTLSHVVRGEPDWNAIPAHTPPRLVRLVRRCLRKKLRDRLQSMGDARIELTELLNEPGFGAAAAPAVAAPQPPARGRMAALVAMAAIAGVAAGAAGSRLLSATAPAAVPRSPVHASLPIPDGARIVGDTSMTLTISPDGRRIAYVALVDGVARLFLHSLTDFTRPAPLAGTENANNPFFSPDGEWLGFFVQNRQLMKMPTTGGATFTVAEVPTGNWGGAWLPDDTIVFAPAFTGEGLMRVPASGGVAAPITRLDSALGEVGHRRPQALPDGRHVLFTARGAAGSGAVILSLATGETRQVLADALDAVFAPTGHLLFSRNGSLFGIRFDLESMATIGSPSLLLEGLFIDRDSGETRFDLSADGNLVYLPGEASPSAEQLVWVRRDGTIEPVGAAPGDYGHPRLSPDGTLIAVDRREEDGRGDIWTWNLRRSALNRLTTTGDNRMPVWSDNGQQIVFASNTGGASGIYWRHADGSGDRHELIAADYSLWPRSWNRDAILYYELNPESGRDIWALSGVGLDSEGRPLPPESHPVVRTNANERAPALSPDGNWIAYVSDASGRDEIYVQAFSGDEQRHTISNGGGGEPVWSRDGSELFYRSGRGVYAVPVSTESGFSAGTPELLFEGDFASDRMGSNQYFDVDVDNQRFLMILLDPTGGVPDHLHVIIDFAEELRARAEQQP